MTPDSYNPYSFAPPPVVVASSSYGPGGQGPWRLQAAWFSEAHVKALVKLTLPQEKSNLKHFKELK